MDVPVSPAVRQRRQRRRWLAVVAGGVVLVAITLGLMQLAPAAPLVEKSSVLVDTVKRGELLRQVRGNGSLVPEEIRWVPALSAGRVEQIFVWPGTAVKADTILVELNNPEVDQAALDAQSQLRSAEAELSNLRLTLQSQRLTQEAAVATAEANYMAAKLDFDVNDELAKSGLVAGVTLKQSEVKADQLKRLLEIEKQRLIGTVDAAESLLVVQEENVSQARAQLDLRRRLADAMKIRAGMDGVLQRLGDSDQTLQIGQQLSPGTPVARVANPAKLKAEIRIAETQARDVQLGQAAEIDTRNGIIAGRVCRIDPAVVSGTVTVDVSLDGELPRGARPDLSVDGTIRLERLENVVHVGRPVQGQSESTVGLFKLVENGRAAVRVAVKLGRSSVSAIEVIDGLQPGDRVILSDMSQWDGHERVRLE
jgi:HlyD family secretion protein